MLAVCSEQLPAQIVLGGCKARRQARQIPDRVDRNLDHGDASVLMHDLAILLESSGFDRRLQFRQVEPARVMAMLGRMSMPSAISCAKSSAARCPHGSSGNDPLRVCPLRKRPNRLGRMGVGDPAPDRPKRAGRDGERAIDRIGAAVSTYHVAVLGTRYRANHRCPRARAGGTSGDQEVELGTRCRMRGNTDMVNPIKRVIATNPERRRPA
jgi:hypothetical protein